MSRGLKINQLTHTQHRQNEKEQSLTHTCGHNSHTTDCAFFSKNLPAEWKREFSRFHSPSGTASTYDLPLTFFAKKLCHMGRIIPSIRWFGWIWLSVQVWLRRILKKRDISTSSSENVSCFGSTADFNPEESSTFGPRGVIDATSFQYDIIDSEPILSFSERNFQWRIFEVEK